MKLFADTEKRKKFMKTGLSSLLTIAWTPIIGVAVAAIVGAPLAELLGWPVTLGLTAIITLLLAWLFLKLFQRTGHRFSRDSR